jgi:hypothetical protein
MRNAVAASGLMLCLISVPAAHAQDDATPEAQAAIGTGDQARLDRDSIGDYGEMRRFDVDIAWNDAAGPRPGDHKNRRARYVADCKAQTLTLAAVAVFDRTGLLEKRMIVPPGAADPIKPEAGTPQAKWLQEVCRG